MQRIMHTRTHTRTSCLVLGVPSRLQRVDGLQVLGPRRPHLVLLLEEGGFRAGRTHFSDSRSDRSTADGYGYKSARRLTKQPQRASEAVSQSAEYPKVHKNNKKSHAARHKSGHDGGGSYGRHNH